MYLADFQLRELCERHQLVSPFDEARINPASVDLTLGRDFVNLSDRPLTYRLAEFTRWADEDERFEADEVRLVPGVALLAVTAERVKVPDQPFGCPPWSHNPQSGWTCTVAACAAELRLKSSAARNGLDHALAGWIDPGFDGQLTLELHAHRPIQLLAGKAYVQLVVAAMLAAPGRSYQQTGRYVGEAAQGAVLAREDK